MRVGGWTALVLMVAGCGQEGAAPSTPMAADAREAVQAESAPVPPSPPQGGAPTVPAMQASAPLLAYSHTYGLELPARAVRPMLSRHEQACVAAGPTVCQVTATEASTQGRDDIYGKLELRARPEWLRTFRAGLEGQATEAGGRIADSGTTTEDLTRSIIDGEAGLRARTTLRDRLLAILASRPGKLSDVLEAERELARVQGEIDATQSTLAVMRTRVATSTLTLEYRSRGAVVGDGVFAPVDLAANDFVRNMMQGVGAILTVVSLLLPWALLIGGGVWVVLRVTRAGRRRRADAKRAPSAVAFAPPTP